MGESAEDLNRYCTNEKIWTTEKYQNMPTIIITKVYINTTRSVQSLSHVWLFATPSTAACQASLSITNSQSLLRLMSIESVMPSNHLILTAQFFSASGSFQMSQFFASGGQSIGVSASASVLPMNAQDWFPLGWTGWISLQSKGLSRFFSSTTVQKYQFFGIHWRIFPP